MCAWFLRCFPFARELDGKNLSLLHHSANSNEPMQMQLLRLATLTKKSFLSFRHELQFGGILRYWRERGWLCQTSCTRYRLFCTQNILPRSIITVLCGWRSLKIRQMEIFSAPGIPLEFPVDPTAPWLDWNGSFWFLWNFLEKELKELKLDFVMFVFTWGQTICPSGKKVLFLSYPGIVASLVSLVPFCLVKARFLLQVVSFRATATCQRKFSLNERGLNSPFTYRDVALGLVVALCWSGPNALHQTLQGEHNLPEWLALSKSPKSDKRIWSSQYFLQNFLHLGCALTA